MPGAGFSPRELVDRYHQAMLDKDANALANLYAENAVHDFPLVSPFFPQRLSGREEIRRRYGALWGASPMRVVEIREIAFHETARPGVIVSEAEYAAEAEGKSFVLAFAIVAGVENGEFVWLRDYMDAFGAAHRLGRLQAVVDALKNRSG